MSKVDELLTAIGRLNSAELAELLRRLDEPPFIGVREPRRPLPSSGSAAVWPARDDL